MVKKIYSSKITKKNKNPNDSYFTIWSWNKIKKIKDKSPKRIKGLTPDQIKNDLNKNKKKSIFNVDFFI